MSVSAMFSFVEDVMLAVYEEHKARTFHDIYNRTLSTANCQVCLFLLAADRDRNTILKQSP